LNEVKSDVINYIVNSSSTGFSGTGSIREAKFKYDDANGKSYSDSIGNSKIPHLNSMMQADTSDSAQIKNPPSNGYFTYSFKTNKISGLETSIEGN